MTWSYSPLPAAEAAFDLKGTATLTGVEAAAAIGTIAASGEGTATLAGVEAVGAIGGVAPIGRATAIITGVGATGGVGEIIATGGIGPIEEEPAVPTVGGGWSGGVSYARPRRRRTKKEEEEEKKRRGVVVSLAGVEAKGEIGQIRAYAGRDPWEEEEELMLLETSILLALL